jgi:hypothetical protein
VFFKSLLIILADELAAMDLGMISFLDVVW